MTLPKTESSLKSEAPLSPPSRWAFAPLLLATYLLVTGNGVLALLIPYQAHINGHSAQAISWFGTSYFGGMLAGAFIVPMLIHRMGSARAFALAVSLGAVGCALLPFYPGWWLWALCRGIIGFSLSALYSVLESWLNASAGERRRARVLAMGSTVQYAAWSSGSQIFARSESADFGSFWLFLLAAVLIGLAVFPVLLARMPEPPRPATPKLDMVWFFRAAPLAFFSAALIGFYSGPFWSLNPVYGTQIGLDAEAIGNIGTYVTLGAAAIQVPAGIVSDRMDRARLLGLVTAASCCASLVLAYFGASLPHAGLYALFFLMGCLMSPPYYVVSAYSVSRCGVDHAVMSTAAILLLYCVGAMGGPPLASFFMVRFGAGTLYTFMGVMQAVVCMLALREWRAVTSGKAAPVGA